jgi:hypothetical protein
MIYIIVVISGIYNAVNISILVLYCVTSYSLVVTELSEDNCLFFIDFLIFIVVRCIFNKVRIFYQIMHYLLNI